MTINEAIHKLDAQKHNTCTVSEKIAWLSALDAMVQVRLAGAEKADFSGYDDSTPADTPLQIPAPFDEVYLYWLEAKIDYINGEFARFNNANAMFQSAWQEYADYCLRTGKVPEKRQKFH